MSPEEAAGIEAVRIAEAEEKERIEREIRSVRAQALMAAAVFLQGKTASQETLFDHAQANFDYIVEGRINRARRW